ncbi:MFS transporter [Thioclava sp. BHET1]|nr:MFS transporter [Thioclava sp. BHET1]
MRRIPIYLRHAPTSRITGFALLTAVEAGIRGVLISVMPLAVYQALGDAALVSRLYFFVGIASLTTGLMVPWLTRVIPRRWMYTLGTVFYMIGISLAASGGPVATGVGVLFNAFGTVTVFVCLNAYVLDYIARVDLGRCQSRQMLFSATSWTAGPVLGVWLYTIWPPAPFIIAGLCTLGLLVTFWVLRLGNGREISRARGPAPNPLVYLRRFLAQPRLVLGWSFAVVRSCGWWVYVVYLPIFCVEHGLGDRAAGVALSVSNAMLFITPLMLRFVQRATVRIAVCTGFFVAGGLFVIGGISAPLPAASFAIMLAGSLFLVLLDVSAGLPFLMAVKPSERTEMAAVYSSFRDVSGIVTPGVAWLFLIAAPIAAVFSACGVGLLICGVLARGLHPRLGCARPGHGGAVRRGVPAAEGV